MPLTVINDPYARGTGGFEGERIGSNLSSGLSSLANMKMMQMQQQQLAGRLGQMGLPAQLAYLPPQLQEAAIKQHIEDYGIQGGYGGQQQPYGMQGQSNHPMMQGRAEQQVFGQQQNQMQPMGQQQPGQIQQPRLTRKERFEAEKAERPYYEETVKNYKTSHSTVNDLNRLQKLINKGGVVNPTQDHIQRWLSGTLKINLKDLRGADTEEYEKIVAGFIKNARQWFGGTVTDDRLQAFLKTLPTLATSHEGKLRLIGSMRAAAQAQQLEYNALRSVMKANGGRIPPYAQAQVQELIAPELERLSEAFVNGENIPELSEAGRKSSEAYNWARYAKGAISGTTELGKMFGLGSLVAPGLGAVGKLAAGKGVETVIDALRSRGGRGGEG